MGQCADDAFPWPCFSSSSRYKPLGTDDNQPGVMVTCRQFVRGVGRTMRATDRAAKQAERQRKEEFQAEYYRATLAMAKRMPKLRGMSPWTPQGLPIAAPAE